MKHENVEVMRARQFSRIYAGAVAVIAAVWWLVLFAQPESRRPFLWGGLPDTVFFAFFPADLFFVIACGLIYAFNGKRVFWLLSIGAFGYATILTVSLCRAHESGWLGAWLMLAGSATALSLEWMMRRDATA